MNNLTTRKIILGLLMVLVLGFGVQGVAEAITRPSGQTEAHLNTVDPDVHDVGGTETVPTTDIAPDRANLRETVSITRSSGITLTGDFYGLSSVTLTEVDDDLTNTDNGGSFTYTRDGRTQTISGTATGTIGITFTAKGTQWVKISATDYDDPDVDNDFSGGWSATYTYYVKGPGTSTTTTTLLGLSNGYKTGIFADGTHRERIHTGDGSHYDVTYTTIPVGAMAQIENTEGALGSLEALNNKVTSSAFDVLLQANATYQVTAKVKGSDPGVETVGTYIIGSPRLTVGYPDNPDGVGVDGPTSPVTPGSKGSGGRINQVLSAAFNARVTDQNITTQAANVDSTTNAVPGVVVTFRVSGGGDAGGYLVFDSANAGTLVSSNNRAMFNSNGSPVTMATEKVLYIRTDENGRANVDFQLGTDRKQDVTISAVGQSKKVSAYAGESVSGNQLVNPRSVVSRALGRAGEYELRVNAVDEDGDALPQHHVEFRTGDGTLEDSSTTDGPTETGRLAVQTDSQGIAFVFFDPKETSGSPRVTAHLLSTAPDGTPALTDTVVDDVVFDIGGTVTRRDPPPSGTQPLRLDISVFGDDGDTSRPVIVNALNSAGQTVSISIPITLSGTALVTSQPATTGAVTTIRPPTDPGTYTLIATDPGGTYASDEETITVGGVSGDGTLDVTTVGVPVNNQQTIEVTLEDADGDAPTGEVVVTLRGPGISRTVDTRNGTGRAIITLPNTATYTLTLSADGYATREVTLSVSGVVQDDTETQTRDTTTTLGGVARSVRIASDPFPSGPANRRLAQPLRVQVRDANNRGVASVRVTFEVVSGQGRLSQRGNGRAIRAQTDSSGNASANYTPLADGTSRVRATAAGVTQTVTFTITAGAAAPSTDDTTPSETGVTPSREINPDVHVRAAQRPPMLWVDGGKIYALVGADVEEFGSGVEGAMNIAVGGGKVYWTEKTGDSAGTINSAKLDGSDAKELKKIKAVPMGIAVDTETGDKLYWTNSRGRIQSADLDGSGIENVMLDLPGPMDIAVARGNLYWTQYDETDGEGNVGIANATGRGTPKYISTGADAPGSIAIGGNKVYWTEMTGSNAGTINSANLNGSGAEELNDIRAVPMGIGVDTARSKLYWTNSRGRVQSANLAGRKIENVVDGLGNPGDMVLSNSISAPAKAPTTDAEQTASTSKYDINGDGSVDSKDVDALIVAVAAGVTDAKYDVNGDGKVDIFDVSAVSSKRDDGAASAPALLGTKLSIVQIDRLQDQIDLLIASNDRSPDTMRLLIYLQQLIVMARPEKTQLLANYPNPFNPETWIPYELATDTTVKITIYNTQGVVIRTLALGHQSAGYYTGRDRAAYWDGRNAFGEQVASGIYFYQFETDEISSMRKMVILK